MASKRTRSYRRRRRASSDGELAVQVVEGIIAITLRLLEWYLNWCLKCWRRVGTWMRPARPDDRHVVRLQTWRSWLGLACVASAIAVSGEASEELGQALLFGALAGFFVKAAISMATVLLTLGAILVYVHPTQRRARMAPVRRSLLLLASILALPLLIFGQGLLTVYGSAPTGTGANSWVDDVVLGLEALVAVAGFVFVLALPFAAVFAAAVLVFGVRHLFCIGDVHPLLPSLLGFVVAVITGFESGSSITGADPGLERVLAVFGTAGAVVVLALVVYEHRRLRGFGWHLGDLRMPLDHLPSDHPVRLWRERPPIRLDLRPGARARSRR